MRRRALVCAALFAIVGAGCVHVGVFGDSITVLSKTDVEAKLRDRFYIVDVTAYPGADTADVVEMVRDQLARGTIDRFVVNTGTNDVQRNIAGWRDDFDELVGLVRSAECVAFVSVTPLVDARGDGTVTSGEINAYLDFVVEEHDNFRLVDWAHAVAEDTTLFDAVEPLHPSASGSRWLGDAYNAAFDDCDHPAATTTSDEVPTTVPEETSTVPEETSTVPEETTTVPDETTTTPDETTVPDETTTAPDDTTTEPGDEIVEP